ncbi:hypothetical protein SAY86_024934 [Trapa natans]|uniref:Protein DEFECTIVE IN MERISTEM SILENCING 3 n=1 Tax=Trapa natans TaxID=22666 RepID=A0AAN7M650_TRANT|nr:hypothetical protein SAY86_024934 [Trapa natans]
MSHSRALVVLDVNQFPKSESTDAGQSTADLITCGTKKLQDDLHVLGQRIKQHEENIRSFKSEKAKLDDAILDKQCKLGNYHSGPQCKPSDKGLSHISDQVGTIDQVLRCGKPAAGLVCQLKREEVGEPSHHAFSKNVLGIVATLGNVADTNLSSLLSEYLGIENMLAVVCKTYEGVKSLETYDNEACIDKRTGLHGLGASVGRPINGRFLVICLENLRPFPGNFVYDDPQRKLDLLKPRQPDGDCPPGFIGYAVNMIELEAVHLQYLTEYGYGLRETLFYNLFRHTQVYKTRTEMVNALPFISDGAISLDGGMVKGPGLYSLGTREDVPVRFSTASVPKFVADYYEMEKEMKELKWKREKLLEDIQRERQLLERAKNYFQINKDELIKLLAQSSTHATVQMGRDSQIPKMNPLSL